MLGDVDRAEVRGHEELPGVRQQNPAQKLQDIAVGSRGEDQDVVVGRVADRRCGDVDAENHARRRRCQKGRLQYELYDT